VMRRVRRWTALAAILAFTASGCQWASGRFDGGNTADNTSEIHLSTANVSHLGVEWSAALGSGVTSTSAPVAAGNVIYVTANSSSPGTYPTLYAFAADGRDGCAGAPTTCAPLWTATGSTFFAQPVVFDGVVYVTDINRLYAYDAAGQTNCSGSPVVCQPLWQGTTRGFDPKQTGGLIYVLNTWSSPAEVDAYSPDTSSCSGSPVVCSPVATYPVPCPTDTVVPGPPDIALDYSCPLTNVQFAVHGSQISLGFDVHLVATLEVGSQPTTTADFGLVATGPLSQPGTWTWETSQLGTDSVALGPTDLVVDDHVYLSGTEDFEGTITNSTAAVSGEGALEWSTPTRYEGLAATTSDLFGSGPTSVDAYSTAGGCGSTCTPERSYHDATSSSITTPPAIAADVLYVGAGTSLETYSATGATDCGGSPVSCSPLSTVSLGAAASNVSISNGRVYVTTADGRLLALNA